MNILNENGRILPESEIKEFISKHANDVEPIGILEHPENEGVIYDCDPDELLKPDFLDMPNDMPHIDDNIGDFLKYGKFEPAMIGNIEKNENGNIVRCDIERFDLVQK